MDENSPSGLAPENVFNNDSNFRFVVRIDSTVDAKKNFEPGPSGPLLLAWGSCGTSPFTASGR